MIRWIVGTSLKLRFLVAGGAALMMVFGVLTLRDTPVDVFPEFAPPRVEVQTPSIGQTAADVESLITVPLEEALNGLPGLVTMRSKSVSQLLSIELIFSGDTDLMHARQLVAERVAAISPALPAWASGAVFIIPPKSATSRVMKIGLTSKTKSGIDLSLVAWWTLRAQLLGVPGVATVNVWGDRWYVYQILVDPERMRRHNVSLDEVMTTLHNKATEVKQVLAKIDGVVEEHVELQTPVPQLQVEVNLAVAQRYGLKPGDVRRAASVLVAGEEVGDIWRFGRNLEVHVWGGPRVRANLQTVHQLLLDTPSGQRVRLGDVATVKITPTPNAILREAQSRRIDIGANVRGRDLGSVARDVERALAQVGFPRGYHAQLLGEYNERQAAQHRLLLFAIVAVLGVALVLQAAFGSWRLALFVVLTLPMALVGGVLAAYASGGVMSLGTLVGFFTVLGIAARNGILMINHFQHLERYEGETFGPALVIRGARERLSPILMTSFATGLALVPLVAAGSIAGHEIEHPMAAVILGGLATSTLLNLFVVPVLYLRFGRRSRHDAGTAGAPAG